MSEEFRMLTLDSRPDLYLCRPQTVPMFMGPGDFTHNNEILQKAVLPRVALLAEDWYVVGANR